jgi:hypothetical protein
MQYPVADIVSQVKIILDQNQQENSIIDSEDNTLELEAIIYQKILHAARHLLETSDVSVIDTGETEAVVLEEIEGSEWGELSAWKMRLPNDYLRLLTLKMSDWKRGVHGTIPVESAEYSQLQSSFAGITGNPIRPVVAEGQHIGTVNEVLTEWRELEIYTSATGECDEFRYCPVPKYHTPAGETTESLAFPEKLYRMLLYQTASLVAATYKDSGLAQLLMNMIYEGEPQDKEEQ